MNRCLQLAKLGSGNVAPNPMVGAVLVFDDKVIGEGYHKKYGHAHAEPNCIASVKQEHQHLIEQSTLYVSLEPCVHFGKTPPCVDLIIQKKIPKVAIGCRDPFPQVNGRGIEKLKAAGVEVIQGILENKCNELNKRFFIFHEQHRPYIILKWAQTANNKIADANSHRLLISNEFTNRIVHKWRSEEMAILIGTKTAISDDPELTTRSWPGNNAIRLVIDKNLQLSKSLKLFNSQASTLVFNLHQHTLPSGKISVADLKTTGVSYYQVTEDANMIHQILNACYQLNIQSVLVEGGIYLLQSFIEEGVWDEARVITNENLIVENGLAAPVLKDHQLLNDEQLFSDVIRIYKKRK